jgi:tripartite-type tricarboxylate transporter receptor subunit TctC
MEFSDLTPALPFIQAGKLKLLAVLSSKRDPDMPNVPAVSETVPGYDGSSWQGFFARAGTPQPIVNKLNAALVADLKRPETAARFKPLGIVAQWDTPDEFRAFIAAQTAKWVEIIRAAHIELQ